MDLKPLYENKNYKLIKERFPHLGLGLEIRWGTPDLELFINDLLFDTKEHTRRGFPPEICKALTDLLMFHDAEFPNCRKPPDSVWDINYLN